MTRTLSRLSNLFRPQPVKRIAAPSRPIRIAFMTTVGVNVGDEFIREGVRSFIDEIFSDYEPLYVNKHDPVDSLSKPLLDELDQVSHKFKDADLIVQSGTPVYWRLDHSQCYLAGWGGPLWDWDGGIFTLAPAKPFLNLGAGTCQRHEQDSATILEDPKCTDFITRISQCAALTTVRDPLASAVLTSLNLPHHLLACPALHAARRVNAGKPRSPRNILAVNLMDQAGHYVLKPENDPAHWRAIITELLPELRKRYKLLFVAHDSNERDFMTPLCTVGERVFFSPDYRDYLELYSRVAGIVANRVHGAVAVAGFGRPAVIIGNDSRIGIARPIGIPSIDSSQVTTQWIMDNITQQMNSPTQTAAKYLTIREDSAKQYVSMIREALARQAPLAGWMR